MDMTDLASFNSLKPQDFIVLQQAILFQFLVL